MQKSLDIFKAEPQSVSEVLCDKKSTGFYMPAYQRPYSWEEKHIKDLFANCDNVFRNLMKSSDAIIFLGTLLTVDDSLATTVFPIHKRNTPTDIKLVIDGQQRLSTLMLIILCLNESLNIMYPKLQKILEKEFDEESKDSLNELRESMLELMEDTDCYTISTQAEHDLYRYFPKIIRSQIDCWGKDEKKAIYSSPLAELFIKYKQHILITQKEKKDKFKEFDLKNLSSNSNPIINNIKEIRKQLVNIEKGFLLSEKENGLVNVRDLVGRETFENCLDFHVDENLLQASEKHTIVQNMILICAFTKFLLHRVCLTYVQVNNESYAFDMFEALNTTGEPLTAIETFVPKVIEFIGNRKKTDLMFDHEKAMQQLTCVTDRFKVLTKAKEKNDKAKALILAFVRAYQGTVKVTSLRDQRDAMIKSYEACLAGEKEHYLYFLKETADFLFEYWLAEKKNLQGLVHHSVLDEATLCLNYLTDLKHDIALSILVQFLLQDKQYGTLETEHSSFFQALKAVTAFSVLWRAMSGGADGIDSVYKQLHEKGFDLGNVKAEAYQLCNNNTLSDRKFNIDDIKAYFKASLEAKIHKKSSSAETLQDQWIDICSNADFVEKSKNTKMLLLAAYHNIELVDGGFNKTEAKHTHFLNMIAWNFLSEDDRVVKVFDKDRSSNNWDSTLFELDVLNQIGNIYVDAKSNLTKSKSWYDLKQNMLQELANDSLYELAKYGSTELSDGAKTSYIRLAFILKYREITYFDDWSALSVNNRTRLMLVNAWDNLQQWLN